MRDVSSPLAVVIGGSVGGLLSAPALRAAGWHMRHPVDRGIRGLPVRIHTRRTPTGEATLPLAAFPGLRS